MNSRRIGDPPIAVHLGHGRIDLTSVAGATRRGASRWVAVWSGGDGEVDVIDMLRGRQTHGDSCHSKSSVFKSP